MLLSSPTEPLAEARAARPSLRRRLTGITLLAAAVLLGWLVLPPALGGLTTSTIVVGDSMLPIYRSGDLVVSRAQEAAVGDVVVYQAPEGHRIVHRVVDGDAERGWVLQGDNNDFLDPWQPTADDVIGVVRLHVPRVGAVIHGLTHPLVWASLFLLTAAVLVWPEESSDAEEHPDASAAHLAAQGSGPLRHAAAHPVGPGDQP